VSDPPGIDYPGLLRQALLGVARAALRRVADEGLPGSNHFLLTFRTDAPEVVVPAAARRRFPEEMTIVLQHQFWNLEVDEQAFSVTLRFAGKPQRVYVPFAALVSFADPSVEFGLRFQPSEADLASARAEARAADSAQTPAVPRGRVPALPRQPGDAPASPATPSAQLPQADASAAPASKIVGIHEFRRRDTATAKE
jgi:hypothetical protein